MKRPNILLITTDQQRFDAVGCNGNPAISTPHIDALAAGGVRFENSFCAAAACQPSRASILTGMYPPAHGVERSCVGQWVHPWLATLPGILSDSGYRTIGIGKMHFEPWQAMCGFAERVTIESKYFGGSDEYRQYLQLHGLESQAMGHHVPGFGRANKGMPSPLCAGDHIDGYIGRRALDTLQEFDADGEQPFFMWLSFCGPHDPYDPPQPYASRYAPGEMPLPRRAPNELAQLPPGVITNATEVGVEKMNLWGITDAEIQRLRALYYGNVSLIDDAVGELMALLTQRGLAANTLLVFTSDHGDCLGDHDLLWKAIFPCDADMKVPLIMHWPQQLSPAIRQDFASGIDLMPTMLAAAGIETPTQCEGIDLLGNAASRDELYMFAEPDKWRYRSRDWAFTWWPAEPFDTLFDLKNDPYELHNLCFENDLQTPPQWLQLKCDLLKWVNAQNERNCLLSGELRSGAITL